MKLLATHITRYWYSRTGLDCAIPKCIWRRAPRANQTVLEHES